MHRGLEKKTRSNRNWKSFDGIAERLKMRPIDRRTKFPYPGDLPALALEQVVKNLTRNQLDVTVRFERFRAVMDKISGLKSLHPHQKAALAWMRIRERRIVRGGLEPGGWNCLPTLRRRRSSSSSSSKSRKKAEEIAIMMTMKTRRFRFIYKRARDTLRTPPNYFTDSCGGALCDEPGLGKTVTVCIDISDSGSCATTERLDNEI